MSDSDGESSYRKGKTVQEVAQSWFDGLQTAARKPEEVGEDDRLNSHSHYGSTSARYEQFTLAGGGPGCDITFLFTEDGDVNEGWVHYYEWGGSGSVYFGSDDAEAIYKALTTAPEDQ